MFIWLLKVRDETFENRKKCKDKDLLGHMVEWSKNREGRVVYFM